MNALTTMHAALRPAGLLLDIRPAPRHPSLEVVRGGQTVRIGQIDDSYRFGTLASADTALQTLIDAGQFVRERETTFTFIYHFDSVEAWLGYMAEHWHSAHIAGDLVARARDVFSRGGGELRIRRTIRAARLRRG